MPPVQVGVSLKPSTPLSSLHPILPNLVQPMEDTQHVDAHADNTGTTHAEVHRELDGVSCVTSGGTDVDCVLVMTVEVLFLEILLVGTKG